MLLCQDESDLDPESDWEDDIDQPICLYCLDPTGCECNDKVTPGEWNRTARRRTPPYAQAVSVDIAAAFNQAGSYLSTPKAFNSNTDPDHEPTSDFKLNPSDQESDSSESSSDQELLTTWPPPGTVVKSKVTGDEFVAKRLIWINRRPYLEVKNATRDLVIPHEEVERADQPFLSPLPAWARTEGHQAPTHRSHEQNVVTAPVLDTRHEVGTETTTDVTLDTRLVSSSQRQEVSMLEMLERATTSDEVRHVLGLDLTDPKGGSEFRNLLNDASDRRKGKRRRGDLEPACSPAPGPKPDEDPDDDEPGWACSLLTEGDCLPGALAENIQEMDLQLRLGRGATQ